MPGSASPAEASLTIEAPVAAPSGNAAFGSDAVADALRALEIRYIALNPGASYRGLHDSLVNYLGNTRPQMLLCLHEEHAVGLAHGWAKVTGTPLAAAVHYRIPFLLVVPNNCSCFNGELHQERVARMRHRPVANRWTGRRIDGPEIDLAGIARAQGAKGLGPLTEVHELAPVFRQAIRAVDAGARVVGAKLLPPCSHRSVQQIRRIPESGLLTAAAAPPVTACALAPY